MPPSSFKRTSTAYWRKPQRTPEPDSAVTGPTNESANPVAAATDSPSGQEALARRLGIPDHYTAVLEGAKANFTVSIDADVMLPDADRLPTARVEMALFSQDTADRLIEALLQGQTLYTLDSFLQETKGDIEIRLIDLYAMRDGKIPVKADGDLGESIALWEGRLADAPRNGSVGSRLKPAFRRWICQKGNRLFPWSPMTTSRGMTRINGRDAYLSIKNWTQFNNIEAVFSNREDGGNHALSSNRSICSWKWVRGEAVGDVDFSELTITPEQAARTGLRPCRCAGTP